MSVTSPAPFGHSHVTVLLDSRGMTDEHSALPARPNEDERFSLVFVVDRSQDKVLLGRKKRGYGTGLVHGFGGKVENNETIEDCAIRELWEESGLKATLGGTHRRGRLVFVRPRLHGDTHSSVIDIALFVVDEWVGEPIETDEMVPTWYPMGDMPLDTMWPDVRLYFPPLTRLIRNRDDYQLLVRVDYDRVSNEHRPDLPALTAIGISPPGEQYDEAIVRYWLALSRPPGADGSDIVSCNLPPGPRLLSETQL